MADYIMRFIIMAVLAIFGFLLGDGFDGYLLLDAYKAAFSVALPLCYIFWTIHRETVEKLKIHEHKIKVLEEKLENIDEKNT